jgi:hypothetical protein
MRQITLVLGVSCCFLIEVLAPNARVYGSACYQASFTNSPRWVSGALARDEDSQLLIVDPMQNKILAYSPTGTFLDAPQPEVKGETDFSPRAVDQMGGDEFLLELVDGSLVTLDQAFHARSSAALTSKAGGLRVGSMYQWKVAGSSLVAYGALLDDKNNTRTGFFRVPLGGTQHVPQMLTPLADSDFYVVGNKYIAVVGTTAYYIAMDKTPVIYKVSAEGGAPEKLAAFPEKFPEEFRERPDFKTRLTGPKNAPAHFAELETFTVVAGLYSQDNMLYVLTRQPVSGQTEWYLYQIDLATGGVISHHRLPTSANHLTIAASKTKWFLIQRGPVLELQKQAINDMVVVDDSAIRSSARLPTFCAPVTASLQPNPPRMHPLPTPHRSAPGTNRSPLRGFAAVMGGTLAAIAVVIIVAIKRRPLKERRDFE